MGGCSAGRPAVVGAAAAERPRRGHAGAELPRRRAQQAGGVARGRRCRKRAIARDTTAVIVASTSLVVVEVVVVMVGVVGVVGVVSMVVWWLVRVGFNRTE